METIVFVVIITLSVVLGGICVYKILTGDIHKNTKRRK